MSPPLVSVIVPSFNEAPAVLAASLQSLRDQTLHDFEVIVVDESTQPERAAACRDFCAQDARFVCIQPTQRLGLAASLNLALERARGEFVARFDADDVCMPGRLAEQVEFLRQHADISVVGGALEIIDEDGRTQAFRRYPQLPGDVSRRMQFTNAVAHPTVMFRREVALRHGVYDPGFRFSEDLDLWLRWLNAGVQFANLPQVLVKYRQKVTRRDVRNWKFNLRARTRNFSSRHLVRRVTGIVCIAIWMLLPDAVQENAFRAMIFRRRKGDAHGRAVG